VEESGHNTSCASCRVAPNELGPVTSPLELCPDAVNFEMRRDISPTNALRKRGVFLSGGPYRSCYLQAKRGSPNRSTRVFRP
jgi:hypothetical protein